MAEEIRWKCRFRNFSRAFGLLREAMEKSLEELNELEREGVIQRFEYTFELAWKTLKDRLEHEGVVLDTVTPRTTIREAFAARMIEDGEGWIDMLTDRNRMSHTYDFEQFEEVIVRIRGQYLGLLDALYERLLVETQE